jgi:hypothetical protein
VKKLTKPQLQEQKKIFNPHDFCKVGGGRLFISYQPRPQGRMGIGSIPGWKVVGIRFHTDPEADFLDHGCKRFTCGTRDKEAGLAEAKAWATEKYGITEWIRDPFGAWQDESVYRKVMEG